MKRLLTLVLVLALTLVALPALTDSISYGGAGDDIARGMIALSDGGWLVYGSTTSTDGDFAREAGNWTGETPWAILLDESGNAVWHYLTRQNDTTGKPLSYIDAAELADGRIALLLNNDSPKYKSNIHYLSAQGEELDGGSRSWEPRFLRICAAGNDLIACGEWDENKDVSPYLYITRITDDVDTVWSWAKSDMRILTCAGIKKAGSRICAVITTKTDAHPYAQAWLLVMGGWGNTPIKTHQSYLPSGDLLGGGLRPFDGGVAYVQQSPPDAA